MCCGDTPVQAPEDLGKAALPNLRHQLQRPELLLLRFTHGRIDTLLIELLSDARRHSIRAAGHLHDTCQEHSTHTTPSTPATTSRHSKPTAMAPSVQTTAQTCISSSWNEASKEFVATAQLYPSTMLQSLQLLLPGNAPQAEATRLELSAPAEPQRSAPSCRLVLTTSHPYS